MLNFQVAGAFGLALSFALPSVALAVTPGLTTATTLNRMADGIEVNYALGKTINGRVARADGTPVKTRFYVQDISTSPPRLVATHETDSDGSYSFTLDIGQWRVIPISAEFSFQPRAREYDTRLNRMSQAAE